MGPISVLLIQRYQLLVEALAESFRRSEDVFLDHVVDHPPAAPAVLARHPVDVVLFDVRASDAPAALIRRMKGARPACKLVLFGLSDTARIVDLLAAGACGFVSPDAPFHELEHAVRQAHHSRAPTSPEVVAAAQARLRRLAREVEVPSPSPLTPQETRVLTFLAAGADNRHIADELAVSLSTVKMHVHNLLTKLHVKGRRAAVRTAARRGLLRSVPSLSP